MPRSITILGFVQLLLIVLGFIGLAIVMKLSGYPEQEAILIRWNPLALFLRQYGLVLLLVPILWVILAALSQNRPRIVFTPETWVILGIVLAATIIALFFYACVNPYTRALWIGNGAPPTPYTH